MNVKFSLALSTALLMTASAFAADTTAPNAGVTPDKMLSTGSTPAISQTEAAKDAASTPAISQTEAAKDAASTTSASQESTTTTTTTGAAPSGTVAGDAQSTETTEVKKTEVKESETQAQSSPAVESSTTGTSTTAATQTTTTAGQPNNVQKLFHMLQHNNQPQSGATSPETQPATTTEKTAQ